MPTDSEIPEIVTITDVDGLDPIVDIHGEPLTLGSRVAVNDRNDRREAIVEAKTDGVARFWVLAYTDKHPSGVIARYLRTRPQVALEEMHAERLG